jgi:tRNA(fMet)-specific endonuclease VapC
LKYLLDTSTLSRFVQRDGGVLARLARESPADLAISSVTRLEIEYGLRANPARERAIGKVVRSFCESLETLAFDAACADRGAEVRAALRARGTPIGPFDLLIGATALRHGLVMVTNNIREFERIDGLRVEDWSLPRP